MYTPERLQLTIPNLPPPTPTSLIPWFLVSPGHARCTRAARSTPASHATTQGLVTLSVGRHSAALKCPADNQPLLQTSSSSAFLTHFAVSAGDFNHRRGSVPSAIRSPKTDLRCLRIVLQLSLTTGLLVACEQPEVWPGRARRPGGHNMTTTPAGYLTSAGASLVFGLTGRPAGPHRHRRAKKIP
jgi:hypothetical protein